MSVLIACGLLTVVFATVLAVDGVLPRVPLEKAANFPFKGLPATNGAVLGFALVAMGVVVRWLPF
jgi:hypothetical protein